MASIPSNVRSIALQPLAFRGEVVSLLATPVGSHPYLYFPQESSGFRSIALREKMLIQEIIQKDYVITPIIHYFSEFSISFWVKRFPL